MPLAVVLSLAAVLLAGCASPERPSPDDRALAQARAGSRPIGTGSRFNPPSPRRRVDDCRPELGPRIAAHVELFAHDRVVLLPAGIGTEPPRRLLAGRITRARCYGPVATLDPTGLVLVGAGARAKLADLFGAWGKRLSMRHLGVFRAPRGRRVVAFVGGRRWRGPPGSIPLTCRAVIVLEVGPFVPPHDRYAFSGEC